MRFITHLKFGLAALLALTLAACGGGSDEPALSPAKISAVAKASSTPQTVTPSQAADLLMEAAQLAYPGIFAGAYTAMDYGPFKVRYYASTGAYLGVVVVDGQGYTMNGIYTVGGGLGGSLSSPMYHGVVTTYLSNITIDVGGGTTTGHSLKIDVLLNGSQLTTVTLQNVSMPNTQGTFCGEIDNYWAFNEMLSGTGYSGTISVTNCSFSGNTGTVTMNVAMTVQGFPINYSFTVNYTFL